MTRGSSSSNTAGLEKRRRFASSPVFPLARGFRLRQGPLFLGLRAREASRHLRRNLKGGLDGGDLVLIEPTFGPVGVVQGRTKGRDKSCRVNCKRQAGFSLGTHFNFIMPSSPLAAKKHLQDRHSRPRSADRFFSLGVKAACKP